jgi:hypothetical protein
MLTEADSQNLHISEAVQGSTGNSCAAQKTVKATRQGLTKMMSCYQQHSRKYGRRKGLEADVGRLLA